MLLFFDFGHLRKDLRPIDALFPELAEEIAILLPNNPQRGVALRRLREAKDAAISAKLYSA
jgi:hypothetical protein